MQSTTTTDQDFGRSINPHGVGILKAQTRRRLAGAVRMGVVDGAMGAAHGPATLLNAIDREADALLDSGASPGETFARLTEDRRFLAAPDDVVAERIAAAMVTR